MPINVGDSVRVIFRGACFGQRILCDLSYRCNVTSPLATPQALDEIITQVMAPGGANNLITTYLACLPTTYILGSVRAQVIAPIRSGYRETASGALGTNANPATTANDSAGVTRRTNLAGRNQLSTLKIGPVPDASAVAGILTGAYQATLSAFAARTLNVLTMPVSTAQYTPTILDKNGVASFRDLANFVVGTTQRVMRRRTVGVGE